MKIIERTQGERKEKPQNFEPKETLMPPCLGFSVAAEGFWVSHSN